MNEIDYMAMLNSIGKTNMDLPHSNCTTDYCYYGHSFVWHSADTRAQFVPKGTHCQCGKVIADGKGGYEDAGSKSYP